MEQIEHDYDDSEWIRRELQALAWRTAEDTDWDEYEDVERASARWSDA